MEGEEEHGSEKQVTMIPTDRIKILNPRVRNRRACEDMVANIASIGLKRPITVVPRPGTYPTEYDLVCGQGRLEAFIELKQTQIPASVIDADESQCLVMSLVKNRARRQHNPIDLMREISTLRQRGYVACVEHKSVATHWSRYTFSREAILVSANCHLLHAVLRSPRSQTIPLSSE